MYQTRSIYLNKDLYESTKTFLNRYCENNDILNALMLVEEDEDGEISEIGKGRLFFSWDEVTTYFSEHFPKNKDRKIRAVWTFQIELEDKDEETMKMIEESAKLASSLGKYEKLEDDIFARIEELEKFISYLGIYETLERPLPSVFKCECCDWKGKQYELLDCDLGYGDIQDNVCPQCENPVIINQVALGLSS